MAQIGTLWIPDTFPDGVIARQVVGDSMTGDGIREGDFLVIDSNREPRDGDIGVVIYTTEEGERGTVVKHVRYQGDDLVLESSDPAYPPKIVPPEANPVIEGVVVGRVRHLNDAWRDHGRLSSPARSCSCSYRVRVGHVAGSVYQGIHRFPSPGDPTNCTRVPGPFCASAFPEACSLTGIHTEAQSTAPIRTNSAVDENGVAGMSAPMRTVCFMESKAAQPYQRVVGQPQSCLVPVKYPSAGARRREASSPEPQ